MNARTFGRKGSPAGDGGAETATASRRAAFLAEERTRAERSADTDLFAPPAAAVPVEAAPAAAEPASEPVFVPEPGIVRERSLTAAYAIWMAFGIVGGHRFYLARPLTGGAQAVIFTAGYAGVAAEYYPAFLAMAAAALWMVADGFLIAGMHRKATGGVFAA
jgi:TM2 domain-containing membrane protein YozV